MLRKYLIVILFFFLFSSCVWKYVTPMHNTPCFTDKKQFEGTVAAGITGANALLAYSPVKYLSLQFNGYSNLTSLTKPVYNNQLEAAIGIYLPFKYFITGLSGGYGMGTTSWNIIFDSGEMYTPLRSLVFDTKKYYLDYYVAARLGKRNFTGVSVKINFMNNFYHKAEYVNHLYSNYTRNQNCFEALGFLKCYVYKKLFFNLQTGMSFLADDEGRSFNIHPIVRFGFSIKV